MISSPGQRAPYSGTAGFHHAPNAALLIDFDNVTMGIRSDLGKELKSLLNSEVIRGKVAVQRAYADWRRYPQYIVPLAESSIDLIFAPAYGSSKKNATDLRMAIDAIELVFTRPEIGTFILMTGDSDFSSCVLKLKEYGKYVIGVGMRESSSDLLIQNCDEYYSYHSLSGLTRTGEVQESQEDPWVLMKRAAQQMEANGDVMRTDRLKQVMLDLDPAFDEKKIGYSKFSRFVQEAATKGVVRLRKGENGQYELVTGETEAESETDAAGEARRGRGRDREGRRDGRRESRPPRREVAEEGPPAAEAPAADVLPPVPADEAEPPTAPIASPAVAADGTGINQAYSLLQAAVRDLTGGGGRSIRDGDVKRRMLDMSPGFDEADLGFSKFTRFLRQAHDAEVIDLQRSNGGNYEVALPASGKRMPAPAAPGATESRGRVEAATPVRSATEAPVPADQEKAAPAAAAEAPATPVAAPPAASVAPRPSAGVGALRGRRGGRPGAPEGPPPILPGLVVAPTAKQTPVEAPPAQAAVSGPVAAEEEPKKKSRRGRRGRGKGRAAETEASAEPQEEKVAAPTAQEPSAEAPKRPPPPEGPIDKITARARRGRAIRGDADEAVTAPPILPGQAVEPPTQQPKAEAAPAPEAPKRKPRRGQGAKKKDAEGPALSSTDKVFESLPKDRTPVLEYLSAYRGVGQKTAESLYDAFGDDTFRALQNDSDRVREVLGARRATTVLQQWGEDFEKRSAAGAEASPAGNEDADARPRPTGRSRSRSAARTSAKPATERKAGEKKNSDGKGRGSRSGRGRKKKESAPPS